MSTGRSDVSCASCVMSRYTGREGGEKKRDTRPDVLCPSSPKCITLIECVITTKRLLTRVFSQTSVVVCVAYILGPVVVSLIQRRTYRSGRVCKSVKGQKGHSTRPKSVTLCMCHGSSFRLGLGETFEH